MSGVKRVALIVALGLLLRGLVALGADTAVDALLRTALEDDGLVRGTVLSQSALLSATAGSQRGETTEDTAETEAPAAAEADREENAAETELPVYVADTSDRAEAAENTPITITGGDGYQSAAGISFKNNTTYSVDVPALLNEPLSFDPGGGGAPTVLILHTHGSEAYEPAGDDWYENGDNYRNQDPAYNVLRVGDELAAALEARGITVLHDRELYDYPSYLGSYGRSLSAAEWYLSQYPSIQIVIDLHRDAIAAESGGYKKTVADIQDVDSAQILLVVGTDGSGLRHDGWRENLKFALRLQGSMAEKYPGLARPLSLREERFNGHVAPGALIVEVGSCGNTMQEALQAGRLFADCAADVILGGGA